MSGGLDGVLAGLIQADKLFAVEAVADAAGADPCRTICGSGRDVILLAYAALFKAGYLKMDVCPSAGLMFT